MPSRGGSMASHARWVGKSSNDVSAAPSNDASRFPDDVLLRRTKLGTIESIEIASAGTTGTIRETHDAERPDFRSC